MTAEDLMLEIAMGLASEKIPVLGVAADEFILETHRKLEKVTIDKIRDVVTTTCDRILGSRPGISLEAAPEC